MGDQEDFDEDEIDETVIASCVACRGEGSVATCPGRDCCSESCRVCGGDGKLFGGRTGHEVFGMGGHPIPTAREAAYDRFIAPLMKQIIEAAKAHDIPMVFGAELDERDDGVLLICRTMLGYDRMREPRMRKANDALGYNGTSHQALAVVTFSVGDPAPPAGLAMRGPRRYS